MRRSQLARILNGDPAASPLGGAHRCGAPYSSHRAPQRVRLGPSIAAALPAERRVPARRGWAGEKAAFLSILRECSSVVPHMQAISVLLCQTHFRQLTSMHPRTRTRHLYCGALSTGAFITATSAGNFRSKTESPRPMLGWSEENSKLATLPLTSYREMVRMK